MNANNDTYEMSRDQNGNRTCRVKPARLVGETFRAFSIQANSNLPETHRNGICSATPGEVAAYVKRYGTRHQREALGLL
jgi:hypothetical protein